MDTFYYILGLASATYVVSVIAFAIVQFTDIYRDYCNDPRNG